MKRSSIINREQGFTLVELIVSAGIIALTVFVLVGVMRKGNEITANNIHRQKARAIIDSCFESPAYHFSNYANMPQLTGTSGNVVIDPRTPNPLKGTLSISVSDSLKDKPPLTIDNTMVAYKVVKMTVFWNESPSRRDTVELSKWVTKLDL